MESNYESISTNRTITPPLRCCRVTDIAQLKGQTLLVNKAIADFKANGKLKAAYQKTLVPVYGEKEDLLAK